MRACVSAGSRDGKWVRVDGSGQMEFVSGRTLETSGQEQVRT